MNHFTICPSCQTQNPITELFCTACFTPLDHQHQPIKSAESKNQPNDEMTTCCRQSCGAEISQNDVECPYCGESQTSQVIDSNATVLVSSKKFSLEFAGQRHQVKETFIFGRDSKPFADCFYPDYSNVSRRHAEIIYAQDGRISIKDLDSANGTFVNEQQLEPQKLCLLKHQDIIRLASDFIIHVIES